MSKEKEKNIGNRIFRLWATIGALILDGLRDPYLVAEDLQKIVNRCVVRVRATKGKQTLEDNNLGDLIEFREDRDFGEALPGSPTSVARAVVHKMLDVGTYRHTFAYYCELKKLSLDDLCWQESQIVVFAEDWSAIFNNEKDSRETYFLCRRSKGLCVVRIGTNENHMFGIHYVYIYALDDEPMRESVSGPQDLQVVIPVLD